MPLPGGLLGVINWGRSTAESEKVGLSHGPYPLVGMTEKDDWFPVAVVEMFKNWDCRAPSTPGMGWPFLGKCGLQMARLQAEGVHEFYGLAQYPTRVIARPIDVPKYEVIGIVPPIQIGQLPIVFSRNPL